ncbi:hypothetical protein BDQ12DRAFT_701426 [Crucibulum laeve]|uniref:CxC6 like cysteine cluster associated with KDZ domain-containing protein n=1 Tax=Crucibulum laeve TaxID=68775 RepID=A0A5C3LIX7_9AGAR|nr:hypothetical protein BDQ12DRAFT_701426 [Crucibulum laeve]
MAIILMEPFKGSFKIYQMYKFYLYCLFVHKQWGVKLLNVLDILYFRNIITGDDPAAVVGIDENQQVPILTGDDADLAAQDAACSQLEAENGMDIDNNSSECEDSLVKMVVLDGIVMGPTHCAFENCIQSIANIQQGVFCAEDDILHFGLCHIKNCNSSKAENSQTCQVHQHNWQSHIIRFGWQTLLGIHRITRHSEEEQHIWLPQVNRQQPVHDEIQAPNQQHTNYFIAPQFYCVETICAPCGVVIAWTKFAKAESPTNILEFLDSVYPTADLQPNYVFIDKACLLLCTAVQHGAWDVWGQTTCFIVDSYHYINHCTTDYIC